MKTMESVQEKDAPRRHDEQKREHAETVKEHLEHETDGAEYHHMKEAKREVDYEIGRDERTARHDEAIDNHELVRDANTDLQ